MNDGNQTRLLNVDMDVRAESGIDELLRALGSSIVVLNHDDPNFASFEIGTTDPKSINEAALLYHHVIQAAPASVQNIWANAECRHFNIGIQVENFPHSSIFAISARSLALLREIDAEVILTIYGATGDHAAMTSVAVQSRTNTSRAPMPQDTSIGGE